ncbi:MAG: antibiotic biosynthesis monooxygenase [Alphaproteobacteria bacterium]|jgi:heme-degrading monooxygenase HmoA|nr:antibiotic biosynthesis monooxygenase [Alphaproteobacteria bacterium]
MTNGWPEEYYAVIFTTQRSDAEMELYGLTSQRMIELAQKQPGFLGLEAVREENGLGITVSYWRDRDAIAAWGAHAEHKVAQKIGRQEFYTWFQLRIAKVIDERSFGLEDL